MNVSKPTSERVSERKIEQQQSVAATSQCRGHTFIICSTSRTRAIIQLNRNIRIYNQRYQFQAIFFSFRRCLTLFLNSTVMIQSCCVFPIEIITGILQTSERKMKKREQMNCFDDFEQ